MQIIKAKLSESKRQPRRIIAVYRPVKDFKEDNESQLYQAQLRVFRIKALYKNTEERIDFQTLQKIQEEINQLKDHIECSGLQLEIEELLFDRDQESGLEEETEN